MESVWQVYVQPMIRQFPLSICHPGLNNISTQTNLCW